jgi:salicylate hydroxylase
MSANPQQASFKIKFVVIGGGIAGLTSAKALRDGGHEVVVIEQISQDKVCSRQYRRVELKNFHFQTEGSLRSPPNMTRLIAAFPGMHEFLSNHATPCTGYVIILSLKACCNRY